MGIFHSTEVVVETVVENVIEDVVDSKLMRRICPDSDIFKRLIELTHKISGKSSHLDNLTKIKHLSGYNCLQDIIIAKYPSLVFGEGLDNKASMSKEVLLELDQIASQCRFYCRFAHACNGVKNDDSDQFIKNAKIDPKELVDFNWESHIEMPAHCIVVLKETKEVILTVRGSKQLGDWVTDGIADYIKFSIMEDVNGRYIQSHANEEHNSKNAASSVNEEEKKTNEDKTLYKGEAHSGIFFSALRFYKIIRPKIDEIFDKLPNDYKLIITGHSLGGGMATIMTLLFLIHPLKYFEGSDLKKRLKCFTFASPSVLGKSMAPIIDDYIINVIHHYDIVPRVNVGSLIDLDYVILEFDEREKNDDILKKFLIDFDYQKKDDEMNETEKQHLKHFRNIYEHLRSKVLINEKLTHFGRSFYIEKEKTKDMKVILYSFKEIKNKDYFNDIILDQNMVKMHFVSNYLEGLSNELKFI